MCWLENYGTIIKERLYQIKWPWERPRGNYQPMVQITQLPGRVRDRPPETTQGSTYVSSAPCHSYWN